MSTGTQDVESPDPTGVGWVDVFEALGMDPGDPQSSPQVRAAVQVNEPDVGDANAAAELIEQAIEADELHRKDGGIYVSGHAPVETESDTSSTQPDDGGEQRDVDDEPGVDETVEVSEDIVERIESLETQNKQQAKEIAELQRKNTTLLEALTNFVSPDDGRTVVGELPEKMRDRGDTFERTSETITRVNQLVEEIDQDLGDNRKQTTDSRVMQLRRFLVQQAEGRKTGKFAMDYKAVQTYFNSQPGDDIGDSWASQLQTKAAQGHHAFSVDSSDGKKKKIRVDLDKIDQGSVYRLKNSGGEEGE